MFVLRKKLKKKKEEFLNFKTKINLLFIAYLFYIIQEYKRSFLY